MASIGREGTKGELKRLIWRDASGKQQSLRLGKCSERAATSALAGFERVLEAHRVGSTLHPDGVRWLEAIDDRLHARVAKLGLAEPRKGAEVVTLGTLLERFEATLTVRPGTRTTYLQGVGMLRDHFGDAEPIRAITPIRADEWRKWIGEPKKVNKADGTVTIKRLSNATVAKRTKTARMVFDKAVRWGMLDANPFADIRCGTQANPERSFYVDRKTIEALLDACPDAQWRAIIGLSRFAGLRCPGELVGLTWANIDWLHGRLTVRSPKTDGHEGHAVRLVPIAPELRAILQDLFDRAEPGTEAVVPRLRSAGMNLRTGFERIITKAGVKPWPRLFHNMRASCATDWVETFPSHAVAGWLGHSPMIAATHYLQTRDAHFNLAAGIGEGNQNPAANPATHTRPNASTDEHDETQNPENPAVLVGCGAVCDDTNKYLMTPWGFEPQFSG